MRLLIGFVACGLFALSASRVEAADDAKWIWHRDGDLLAPGKAWFRHEVRATEPSTGEIQIACDDPFVLWVNNQRMVEGEGSELYRFNLNGIVERGLNVIAVEATRASGGGLAVVGEIRGQGGDSIPFDSGSSWLSTRAAPEGDAWRRPRFDTTDWTSVTVLLDLPDVPHLGIEFGDSYLERFQLPPGFEIAQIAGPELVGSLIAMTWGNDGRLLASREKGPVWTVTDEDGDGVYDKVIEFSTEVANCQGLCMVFDDLYLVGDGPQGTGMYRLPDKDHDGRADEVVHVVGYKGKMGEHGPHDVIYSADGSLYHNLGNHAWIQNWPELTSPILSYYEGDLLYPRYEDPNGHAAGIPVPGGTIWRFTPDGQKWYLHTIGFRNAYDFAANSVGEIFAFDSDMEWEVGMPFYKPVRITHCTPGSDFGWRSNAGKWPSYYLDSLPATVDVGRGSPTGVVFYEHRQFPEKYRGSLIACDWSMGRILAVPLTRDGATYQGTWENLVTGNPLNVSDVEVDRDGSVVFCTGGRGTEGGIYRVTYRGTGADASLPAAESVADALDLPQPSAAWSREAALKIKNKLGDRWLAGLTKAVEQGPPNEKIRAMSLMAQLGPAPKIATLIAATKDPNAEVVAFATMLLGSHAERDVAETLTSLLDHRHPLVQRRAFESFVRSGLEAPVDGIIKGLKSEDRFVRYAARIALERVPANKWKDRLLRMGPVSIPIGALLTCHRLGPNVLSPDDVLAGASKHIGSQGRSDAELVDLLRIVELALAAGAGGDSTNELEKQLLVQFPRRHPAEGAGLPADAVNREISLLLSHLQVDGAAQKIVQSIEGAHDRDVQIHYVMVSSYLKTGWNPDLNRRLLDWYDSTQDWEGGHSFARYIENFMAVHLERFTQDERAELLATWIERPFATRLLISTSGGERIAGHEEALARLLTDIDSHPGVGSSEDLVAFVIDALGRSPTTTAQQLLRNLFENHPDRREQIARALAREPSPENWDLLVKSLGFGDRTTLQFSLRALSAIDRRPEKPEEFRSAILAGLRLGDRAAGPALRLLANWTGGDPGDVPPAEALAHYQGWFRERYPNEPAPELPQVDQSKARYSIDELLTLVEGDSGATKGDPSRGKEIFTKANCVKCHKFGAEGQGVGPDLTTVRRRFQRKEIAESLVFPSQVVSDQYRSITVETVDGLIHTGMPAQQPDDDKLVLVLSDATRLEIPTDDIAEQSPSPLSVMPEGVLRDVSPEELVDLFAFLETSKSNDPPATPAGGE